MPGTNVLPLLSLLLIVGAPTLASSQQSPAVPVDTLIDVGGHRLHFNLWHHRGDITLVFEAGGAANLGSWDSVPAMAARTLGVRVVAYDRAGLGSSETGPLNLTPAEEIDHLARALSRLGGDRIVLIGHSYGGLLSLYHALRHPGRIVGLVLVDPMNPDFIKRVTLEWLNSTVPEIAHPTTPREIVVSRMKRTIGDLVARTETAITTISVPVVVLTAGLPWWGDPARDEAWRASHETIAAGKPNRRLIVASRSRHDIPGTEPETVVEAIRLLLTLLPS